MTYKFVTREELDSPLPVLYSRELVDKILKERDAYREVAIDKCFLGVAAPPNGLGPEGYKRLREELFPEDVDSEASRLLGDKNE